LALAAQPAAANQDVACPEGQAIRAIGDKTAVCVPVPPPVDLAPLNAAINAEAVARMAADQELRDSIVEPGISGQYAFTGSGTCLSSSTGFAANLLPTIVFPPPPLPGQPPATGTILTVASNTVSGVRTFIPGATGTAGTGTAVATFHTVTYPSTFIPFTGNFRSGGATISTLEGTFSYVVDGDTLIIDDNALIGVITKGGIFVGAQVSSIGVPQFVGKISKDRKTIAVTQADVVVEQNVLTPVGQPQQITDRVCHRERTLRKIHD